jgi:hypothetical protein
MKSKFYFVKNDLSLVMLLIIGFAFLVYLFPFNAVFAAKIQSGVTVVAPAAGNPQPAGTCTDGNNDGVDDVTGQPCSPTGATPAGTCGLQIVSGVPINYGQLNIGQVSPEQKVTYTNIGNVSAQVGLEGGNWISGNQTIIGPSMWTNVANVGSIWQYKIPLAPGGLGLGQLAPGDIGRAYFQLKVPTDTGISGSLISGSLHQEITLVLNC